MEATVAIQQFARGKLARCAAQTLREASSATVIQSAYRGHRARTEYRQSLAGVVLLQACVRRRIAMKQFKLLKADSKSIGKMQEKLKAAEQARKTGADHLESELKALKEDRTARVADLKKEILELKEANDALTMERDDLLEVGEALTTERDEHADELGQVKLQLSQVTSDLQEMKDEAMETITDLEAKVEELTRKSKVSVARLLPLYIEVPCNT
jgi:myosin-5